MKKAILIVLTFLCLFPLAAFSSQITVAASANVQFALDDLKVEFTRETGIDVKAVIASSGQLTAQAENGAPFDVFLSADMEYPFKLYQGGFSSQAPRVYVYGVLVLWTMKNFDLSQGINVLNEPGIHKIALPNPRVAPYGAQAEVALKFYKLYESLQKKLVLGESISQVNQFISTGAADLGFTAKSAVVSPLMKDKGKWIEVPPGSYKPIAQGVVVLKYAEHDHSKEAHQFYDFLFSAPAREIFRKYGYHFS